jgi:hypothetical protein
MKYYLSRTFPNKAARTISTDEPMEVVWFIRQLNSCGFDWQYDGIEAPDGKIITPIDDYIELALDDRMLRIVDDYITDRDGKPVLDPRDGHQRHEVKQNVMRCHRCGNVFGSIQEWYEHPDAVEERGMGPAPYPCQYCSCGYADPFGLTGHIRDMHPETMGSRYPCEEEGCKAGFNDPVGLSDHIRESHS